MLVVSEKEINDAAPLEPAASLLPSKKRQDDVDLDITPMIDMVFLLLIFFLVSSTPDQKTSIELPPAQHGVAVSQSDAVIVTLGEGGLGAAPAYAADGRIPGTELPDDAQARSQRIRELVELGFREDKTKVVIKGDKNVAHRDVAQVIKAASQVNGIKIHLAVLDSEQ
jgi:biopolymer transport protein ExbD